MRWGYPVLGALLVALYARTVAPGPTFSDGPEIVTGIVTLGVIHPTGYPLFTLLAHVFVKLLPLDVQPCIKVSLFNALSAGAGAIFAAHSARAMALLVCPPAGTPAPPPREPGKPAPPPMPRDVERRGRLGADIAGLFAGLLLGTSPLLWDQVRIPEVYPFHLFLAAWAFYGLMRFEITRRPGWLVMSGLAMGLGLTHHVTMVYMLGAAILYAAIREPSLFYSPFVWPVARVVRFFKKGFLEKLSLGRAWVFPTVLVVGFLPAFFYGYLIWANRHTVGINWGGVNDWDGLYFHMMGKQYTKFMAVKDISNYLNRLAKLPDAFDKQFLTVGTLLVFPGIVVAFRRAWRPALLLLMTFLFFIGHGVYYSVGDYQTYWLPAVMAMAIYIAVGLDWLLRWTLQRAPEKRLITALVAATVVFAATSLSVLYYASSPKRFPTPMVKYANATLVFPLAGLALAAAVTAYVLRRRARKGKPAPRLTLPEKLLPGFLLASAVLPSAPAIALRVSDIDERQVIGDSYGREVVENAPRGSAILVQGDGYLFTLWYQTHVMGRGTDSAIVDVGSLGAAWYKKYLTSHYPIGCDPLSPEHQRNREAYTAKCDTFRKRMDLGGNNGWISTGDRKGRGVTANERQKGVAILKEWLQKASGRVPRFPRTDARCEDAEFRKGHGKECRCWFDPKKEPTYIEECVFSAEEHAIVPRERVEMWMHHLIEEHIDERPIFERNLFTHWKGEIATNVRGWSGPDYQRPSGEFAMVNRGRVNQIIYATQAASADACTPTRTPIEVTTRGPQNKPKESRPYIPNEWPTLITSSFLVRAPAGGDDSATRSFTAGEEIRLNIDWFEKIRYDFFAPEHKGTPLKHGIRVCFFDGNGQKVGSKNTVSGRKDFVAFKLPADSAPGNYHVAACTVGELGSDNIKFPDDLPCKRLVLEYSFSVAVKKK